MPIQKAILSGASSSGLSHPGCSIIGKCNSWISRRASPALHVGHSWLLYSRAIVFMPSGGSLVPSTLAPQGIDWVIEHRHACIGINPSRTAASGTCRSLECHGGDKPLAVTESAHGCGDKDQTHDCTPQSLSCLPSFKK